MLMVGVLNADIRRGAVLFLMIQPGARATGMGGAFAAVADDPTATYWNPAGLAIYPLASEWHELKLPESDTVYSIAVVKSSWLATSYKSYTLYIVTNKGLFKLDEKEKWIDYEELEAESGERLSSLIYRYLPNLKKEDINSRIIPNLFSINKLDTTEQDPELYERQKIKLPYNLIFGDRVNCIVAARDVLYVGTRKGLFVRDNMKWEKLGGDSGLGSSDVRCVFEDDNGGIWVGTDNGLYVRKGVRWFTYKTSDGLPSNRINDIFVRESKYAWVATDAGVGYFDGVEWKRTYRYDVLPGSGWDAVVSALFSPLPKNKKELFIEELVVANRIQDRAGPVPAVLEVPFSMPFESAVTAVYGDKNGNIWFGTESGIIRYTSGNWYFYGYSIGNVNEETDIRSWLQNKYQKTLTDDEASLLVRKVMVVNRLNVEKLNPGDEILYPSSPASGHIYSIAEGPGGKLLFGSSYGLLEFVDGVFRYYTHNNLHTEQVHNVIRAGNEFWFGRRNGVSIYSGGKKGLSLMHVKWLPELANDLYYEYLTGNYYLEGWGTFGAAITFLSMGQNEWRDEQGNLLGTFTSYDMAFSASYGTSFTDWLRFGLTFKFIYSHLAEVGAGREKGKGIATSFAVDAGLNGDMPVKGLRWATVVQNIGPNIAYIDAAQADPLPRNLKLGVAFTPIGPTKALIKNEYNRLSLALDINKDLIDLGSKPFKEEVDDIIGNIGVEYSYADFLFLRGGFVRDKYIPPDGTYFTFGAGVKYANFQFDFAYIPKKEDLTLSGITRVSISVSF